jgi:hypothetical protein
LSSIYIMKCGEYRKIGVSNNPEARRKTMQTGNPEAVILEHFEERDLPYVVESYLHRHFRNNRTRGEWFRGLSLNDIRLELITYTEG